MAQTSAQGQTIILDGAPRSGKSSIVAGVRPTTIGLFQHLATMAQAQKGEEMSMRGRR